MSRTTPSIFLLQPPPLGNRISGPPGSLVTDQTHPQKWRPLFKSSTYYSIHDLLYKNVLERSCYKQESRSSLQLLR